MAKTKTTTHVDVGCSLTDLYAAFVPFTLVSRTRTQWLYEGADPGDMVVIAGRNLNRSGDSLTTGEVSSIQLLSGDETWMEFDYGKRALPADLLGAPPNIFELLDTAHRGNDLVLGGPGDDYISAGAGRDVIRAGGGSNAVLGGEGNDRIDVGAGNDSVDLSILGGTDTVLNFDADGGPNAQDFIWAFFSACNIVADGKNTIIEIKGQPDELHLMGVKSTKIDESDFLF